MHAIQIYIQDAFSIMLIIDFTRYYPTFNGIKPTFSCRCSGNMENVVIGGSTSSGNEGNPAKAIDQYPNTVYGAGSTTLTVEIIIDLVI